MNLATETCGDILCLTVCEDRIDAGSAIQFKDKVRSLTDTRHPRVVMDLSQVAFLDSSGLGAVVAAMKALGQDRSLELAGLTPAVAKVFRLTRMERVFTIHDRIEDVKGKDASAA